MTVTQVAPEESIRLSNSKMGTFRRCQKQYEFKYVHKLRKKKVGLPLKRGDWLHQLLMVHYDGEDWKKRHLQLAAQFNKLFDEEKEEYGDLPTECSRIMRSYLAHYREEDKLYRVVDSELDEIVDLPNGDKLNIIIDLVLEDVDGGLWIMDHKTVGSFLPADFQLIDQQLALYFWAMIRLGYKNLQGAMFNEVITKPPTLPKFLEKSQRLEMRKNIHCDAYTYYGEIKKAGQNPKQYRDFLLFLRARHGEWFRRTRLPRDAPMVKQLVREAMATGDDIRTSTGRKRFPHTPRKECRFDCDYLNPCIIELQGGDISDEVKMRYEVSKRDKEELPGWVGK